MWIDVPARNEDRAGIVGIVGRDAGTLSCGLSGGNIRHERLMAHAEAAVQGRQAEEVEERRCDEATDDDYGHRVDDLEARHVAEEQDRQQDRTGRSRRRHDWSEVVSRTP